MQRRLCAVGNLFPLIWIIGLGLRSTFLPADMAVIFHMSYSELHPGERLDYD